VLRDLGLEEALETRVIEVLTKIDLLDAERRAVLAAQTERRPDAVAVSAVTGEGASDLLARIDARLAAARQLAVFRIALADGAAIAWLYQHGQVQDRHDDGAVARMAVSLDPADLARFERMGHTGQIQTEPAREDPELSAVS
jgi:GTP-binding protein HflX